MLFSCICYTMFTTVWSACIVIAILSHLFPLPCGAGSTVPREGFDSSVIMPFSWCGVAVTLPIFFIWCRYVNFNKLLTLVLFLVHSTVSSIK